ncbi:hypothetical protein Bca52824_026241 [Brassica carinata]|uniref:Uncharacterized protein n=1 Tax=Brassica carinata TaxID=52824 RepID=A0A8X7SHM2_BRACI|nr:hypothetical protein Bca52824_026241 [Brassica carinata]
MISLGASSGCLFREREISPKTKSVPRKRWGVRRCDADSPCGTSSEPVSEQRHNLISWYLAFTSIQACFIAELWCDHTVNIIDCETGKCLKVLSGHRRTPWVVRFHPRHSEIVASGSLDHEVRLWNAKISDLMISVNRPIASIAFHAEGDILAVASGHKVWHYDKTGEDSTPAIVLKTRRSLRAVHFHPHRVPLLLTAEVTDIDSSDSALTRATSPGYLRYPPPAIFFTNTQSGGSHTSMS